MNSHRHARICTHTHTQSITSLSAELLTGPHMRRKWKVCVDRSGCVCARVCMILHWMIFNARVQDRSLPGPACVTITLSVSHSIRHHMVPSTLGSAHDVAWTWTL